MMAGKDGWQQQGRAMKAAVAGGTKGEVKEGCFSAAAEAGDGRGR